LLDAFEVRGALSFALLAQSSGLCFLLELRSLFGRPQPLVL
jgi:hypothetical protein